MNADESWKRYAELNTKSLQSFRDKFGSVGDTLISVVKSAHDFGHMNGEHEESKSK